MKDPFEWLDNWNNRINFLSAIHYWRLSVFFIAFLSLILWVILGFDSGIGMIQMLIATFPEFIFGKLQFNQWIQNTYHLYGVTGHFSAVIIYCLLFVLLSRHLEKLGIVGSKNLFISLNLVFLNGALFEIWYQFSYAIFQTPIYLVQWVTEFLGWYIVILVGGLYTILYFYACSFTGKVRTYTFHFSKPLIATGLIFIFSMLLWWFYPGSFIQYGTRFFPQTVYAGLIYIPNDGIHLANLFTKTMFAITEFVVIKGFKRCGWD